MNAKITYTLYRQFSLDRISGLRLLAEIEQAPAVNRSGNWCLEKDVKWVCDTKTFMLEIKELENGRIDVRVSFDEKKTVAAVKQFNILIEDADNGLVGSIRKAMLPGAAMTRALGKTAYWRVRDQVEFLDLMAYTGVNHEELPEFPCLISHAGLEVKRVFSITEADLLAALSHLTGTDYSLD